MPRSADVSPHSISPAEPSCTSLRESRRWSVRYIWAVGLAIPKSRCRRIVSCSVSSERACCGWGGLASTRAARWLQAVLRPAPLWLRISRLRQRVLGWSGAEWLRNGKPSALGAISGGVAGLVAITPAAGFVGPMPALAIGLIAGVVCYHMVATVKLWFGYDDSLDAFGVHGAGGTLGAVLTGVFASSAHQPDLQGVRKATHCLQDCSKAMPIS